MESIYSYCIVAENSSKIGVSKAAREQVFESGPQDNLIKENERLRKENRLLREEREVLKKATIFFAGQKP